MSEFRFYSGKFKDYPYHFWLVQLVTFTYSFYRLISRDYSIYGEIPVEYFNYPRPITNLYPTWILEILNTHWVYWILEYPSSSFLEGLQKFGLLLSLMGLFGILPKISAIFLFIILTHFTGFIQATNAEIEGGTLLLVALLTLSLSPKISFYKLGYKIIIQPLNENRWPVFLLFLFVGTFYTTAGLNKIFDVGLWWPFTLHLENLGVTCMEKSVFLSSRRVDFDFCSMMNSYWLSTLSGFITLIGEIGFISILFLPRYRSFFIVTMITLHVSVYLSAGINFLGSSFILILCFDWNTPFRKATVYYDQDCGICQKTMEILKKFDNFNRINIVPAINAPNELINKDRLTKEMGVIEENGEVYYGADAFEIVFEKIPLFWPFALIYKIPGVIYLARGVYIKIASNRHQFGDRTCKVNL